MGLDPVPGPPFAFSLSETSIRYAAFARGDSGVELVEFQEVALPPTAFGEGVLGPSLQEEGSLRAAIEELLSRLASPPDEASLVVPDSWLRVVFTEAEELPRSAQERDEVLRWKLKRVVPFKVDKLRLRTLEVEPLAEQTAPHRLLLAFGAEALLSQIEAAFSAQGIRLGRISNVSLSLLEAAWKSEGRDGTQAIVSANGGSYTIVFAAAGRPVLYRFKPLAEAGSSEALERLVRRELRLTRTFVERHVGPPADTRMLLFAPAEQEAHWDGWLCEELGIGAVRRGSRLVDDERVDAERIAPLLGAASALVA